MENLSEIINNIIAGRKSTYTPQFEPGAKIDDEVIWQILENANLAPTHKKTEPWRFTVFSGEGLQKLADLQVDLVKKHRPDTPEAKIKKLAEKPLKASHIITITMKRHKDKVPEIEEILAVGCALENMYLSANAYGLACYFSTGGVTYIEEAKSFFELEQGDKLIGFFYVGQKKIFPDVKISRGGIKEKVRWVR